MSELMMPKGERGHLGMPIYIAVMQAGRTAEHENHCSGRPAAIVSPVDNVEMVHTPGEYDNLSANAKRSLRHRQAGIYITRTLAHVSPRRIFPPRSADAGAKDKAKLPGRAKDDRHAFTSQNKVRW